MVQALERLQKEWIVISSAPWEFVIAVVLLGSLIYSVLRWQRAAEVGGLKEQVRLKDVQLTDRDRLLRELRPDQTAYSLLSNATLKDKADRLAEALRAFHRRQADFEIQDDERIRVLSTQAWPAASLEAARKSRLLSWTSEFKGEAMLPRGEIFKRIPPGAVPGGIMGPYGYRIDLSMYGNLQFIFQIDDLATHLQCIAKLLNV
jgi:hypothetical protein